VNASPASEDLYERLGVAPDATPDQIRSAYKAMRKELHPDARPEPLRAHFDGLMQNVNEAHQTLTDPRARAKYDQKREAAGVQEEEDGEAAWGEWKRMQDEAAEEEARRERQEQERREREAREREERRRREAGEAAWREEEERYWSEDEDGAADRQSQRGSEPPVYPAEGSLLWRLPTPVHRAGVYATGMCAWFIVGAAVWFSPVPVAPLVAATVCVGISVMSGAVLWATADATALLESVFGRLTPRLGRVSAAWFARRTLESFVVAPGLYLASAVWSAIFLAAIGVAVAYVALWAAEALRHRLGVPRP
jgi:curved DNA-binding protein CbpA